jgi:hypothetical protein
MEYRGTLIDDGYDACFKVLEGFDGNAVMMDREVPSFQLCHAFKLWKARS